MKAAVMFLIAPLLLVQTGLGLECACIGCDGQESACGTSAPTEASSCCAHKPPAGPSLRGIPGCDCLHLNHETLRAPETNTPVSNLTSAPPRLPSIEPIVPDNGTPETTFLPYNNWTPPPPLRTHLLIGVQLR